MQDAIRPVSNLLSPLLQTASPERKAEPKATRKDAGIHQVKDGGDISEGSGEVFNFWHYAHPGKIIQRRFSTISEARMWGMINGWRLD